MKSMLASVIFSGWVSTLFLFPKAAIAEEKIISCTIEKTSQFDPADTFGPKVDIEVWQTPDLPDYRWHLKIFGSQNHDFKTNGPINQNGTTVSSNGEEGLIYYGSFTSGLKIVESGSNLVASFNFIEEFPNNDAPGGYEYYLVEYLGSCHRTGIDIDQSEANIFEAKARLVEQAVALKNPKLQGAGVTISETGMALSIAGYVKDEAQKQSFIQDFVQRKLIYKSNDGKFFYILRTKGVTINVLIEFEILGDVTPIP